MRRSGFLERWLAVDGALPALYVDRWWTHGELRELGERAAGGLAARGVAPGDAVAIHLENGIDVVAAHLGCMALGAVRVPLNPHSRAAELRPILEDAAPSLVISRDPDMVSVTSAPTADAVVRGTSVGDWRGPEVTAILFTSGTTGRPKGAPQSWEMWERNLDALAERWDLSPQDQLWLALPLFHTHGLVLGLHGTLLRGGSAWLSPRFDPVQPPPGTTLVYGVPTFYRRWLDAMRGHREWFAGLRLMVSGSDGLPAAVSDDVHAATGHRVLERYGMTETVMIASNPFRGERRAGTVGTPLPGVDVRISVDGEIQVRGPSVFRGYSPRPDPLAFTADGYFRTGDAGGWDDAGYLRIVGRLKDLVIVGGENVSPAEVEAALRNVHGVADLGCCGLPDPDLGEIVACAVVPDASVAEATLLADLRRAAGALAGLKRPRRYFVVDALPKNALGKLQRRVLAGSLEGAG